MVNSDELNFFESHNIVGSNANLLLLISLTNVISVFVSITCISFL